MNFYENIIRKHTSKQTNKFYPLLHAKSLSLMTMTLTLEMPLSNCCFTTLSKMKLLNLIARWLKLMNFQDDKSRGGQQVSGRRDTKFREHVTTYQNSFDTSNFFMHRKKPYSAYLKYFRTFTIVSQFYVNKLLVNKQQEYTRKETLGKQAAS